MFLHPYTGRSPNRRAHNGETTTSEESPDLSELSDMELDRSIRSAWSNRGGWSASQDTLVGAVGGAVGGASASSSPTRSISAREVIDEVENRNRSKDDMGTNIRNQASGIEPEKISCLPTMHCLK